MNSRPSNRALTDDACGLKGKVGFFFDGLIGRTAASDLVTFP
jgi:hypothetical protein